MVGSVTRALPEPLAISTFREVNPVPLSLAVKVPIALSPSASKARMLKVCNPASGLPSAVIESVPSSASTVTVAESEVYPGASAEKSYSPSSSGSEIVISNGVDPDRREKSASSKSPLSSTTIAFGDALIVTSISSPGSPVVLDSEIVIVSVPAAGGSGSLGSLGSLGARVPAVHR